MVTRVVKDSHSLILYLSCLSSKHYKDHDDNKIITQVAVEEKWFKSEVWFSVINEQFHSWIIHIVYIPMVEKLHGRLLATELCNQ